MRRIFALVLLIPVALAGCGAPSGPDVATAGGNGSAVVTTAPVVSGDREERVRRFAGCMREHGVDMPDPEPGPGGLGLSGGGGALLNDPDFQTAFEACRTMLPNGGEPPKLSPEQLEQYRAFAGCMREHGVDVPDPDPDGTLRLRPGPGGRFGGINPSDPKVQAALTACRDKLTGLFPGRTATPRP
jgi:hypothetical protein